MSVLQWSTWSSSAFLAINVCSHQQASPCVECKEPLPCCTSPSSNLTRFFLLTLTVLSSCAELALLVKNPNSEYALVKHTAQPGSVFVDVSVHVFPQITCQPNSVGSTEKSTSTLYVDKTINGNNHKTVKPAKINHSTVHYTTRRTTEQIQKGLISSFTEVILLSLNLPF